MDVLRLQDIVDFHAPENTDNLKRLIVRKTSQGKRITNVVTLSNRDFEEAWRAADKPGENVRDVKFRMREQNWDVSPPTAAELQAEGFEKSATLWDIPPLIDVGLRDTSVGK